MIAIAKAIVLDLLLAYLFYDSWIAGVVLLPVAIGYFQQWREECCRKKELEFRMQFRDAMQIMASSLKVGYSVENAIRSTEKEFRKYRLSLSMHEHACFDALGGADKYI